MVVGGSRMPTELAKGNEAGYPNVYSISLVRGFLTLSAVFKLTAMLGFLGMSRNCSGQRNVPV